MSPIVAWATTHGFEVRSPDTTRGAWELHYAEVLIDGVWCFVLADHKHARILRDEDENMGADLDDALAAARAKEPA